MMFKKKRKLNAVTWDLMSYQMFPIVPAKEIIPDWYKTMPHTIEKGYCPVKSQANQASTVRSCYGINTLLKTGFVMRAWSDVSILVYPNGEIASATPNGTFNVTAHPTGQHTGYMDGYRFIKLGSPWYMFDESDTKYMFTNLPYHSQLPLDYIVPTGILEFNYQHDSNFFLGVKVKPEPYEVYIPAGTPLAHLIPLTEDKIELNVEFDKNVREYAGPPGPFFTHQYKKKRHNLGKNDRKCPFSVLKQWFK